VAERRAFDARIARRPVDGLISLQAGDEALPGVEAALGTALARAPATLVRAESLDVLQLGPQEWLLRFAAEREAQMLGALQAATLGRHAAVTLVSDAWVGFEVRGADAAAVLAQGCPLDLDAWPESRCARTLLTRVQMLIAPLAAAGFELWVERSHATYAALWLEAAAGGTR
jgi:heterotetrameric sarcosine oxidase gamma subunit